MALNVLGDDPALWTWGDWGNPVTVGNITVTTLISLEPDTYYQWRIAPLTEDQVFATEWQEVDLYGRRPPLPGFVRGEFSPSTVPARTLKFDFQFT